MLKSCNSVQRLFNYQKIYDKKKEDLRENFKETFPFKPQISKNTDVILKNRENFVKQMNRNIEQNIENRIKQISPESRGKIEEIRRDINQGSNIISKEESKEIQNKFNLFNVESAHQI